MSEPNGKRARIDAARASLAYFEAERAKTSGWDMTAWRYWNNRVVDTKAKIDRLEERIREQAS